MPNCPSCKNLVGVGQVRCHRCGATIVEGGDLAPLPSQRTDPMAITGLVLSLIPCLLTGIAGLVLGILSLGRIKRDPALTGRGLAVAAVAIASVWSVVGGLGILAAIAIPNFIRFQQRAKTVEARTHLAAIRDQYQKTGDSQPRNFEALGYTPGPGRKYTYWFGTEILEPDHGVQQDWPQEARYGQRAVAAANLDADETLDVWVLTEEGQIEHLKDDIKE
jgi:type II secretory pathway pseudopilin PulG